MADINKIRETQSQPILNNPPIVKPPVLDRLSPKDEAILNLGNRVEKIEKILNQEKKGAFWKGMLYTVIGAIVGAVVSILTTNMLS